MATQREADESMEKAFSAHGSRAEGLNAGYDLAKGSALGLPELIYITRDGRREVLLQADVFEDHLHLHCAVCKLNGGEHGIMIRKGMKDWLFEPLEHVTFPGWESARMMAMFPKGSGGRLSVGKFKCPWCKTTMAVDKNVVVLA
jgi:hypothetical protein